MTRDPAAVTRPRRTLLPFEMDDDHRAMTAG